MTLKKIFLNVLTVHWEPRILHNLSGRVRIHLPLLKKIPAEFHSDAESVLSMASLIREINHASVSFVTGNILIQYNPQKLAAHDILKAFIYLNQLIIQNRQSMLSNSTMEISELKQRLPALLSNIDLKTFDVKELEAHAL